MREAKLAQFQVTSFEFQALARRRAWPLATTAAALSLAGCGMLGGVLGGPKAAAPVAPASPEQVAAEQRVQAYSSDIEAALDKVDRDRLRAAAERKPPALVPVMATGAPTPAAGSAAAGAAPQVILASATPPGAAAVVPMALPATPAPALASGAAPQAAPQAVPSPSAVAAGAAPLSAEPPGAAPGGAFAAKPAAPVLAPDAAPALPMTLDPSISGLLVAPMSGEPGAISSAVITPFTPPNTPSASAMGSMTALATPAQAAPAWPAAQDHPAGAELDEALNVLRKNVGEHPTLNTALALALLDGGIGGGGGGEALSKLPAGDQIVLTDLLGALEAMQAKPAGATLAVRAAPLVDAAKHWQEDADLSLPRMVLATRVDSFGVFTPVSGPFEQGKRHTVIIYCEVANFASKKGDDGWYTTKLSQQETLITDDGLLVWRPNAEEVEDRSLNQRHDFYLVKKLTIPETLAAGKYTLRMSVTDRNTNKISMVSMPVEVVVK